VAGQHPQQQIQRQLSSTRTDSLSHYDWLMKTSSRSLSSKPSFSQLPSSTKSNAASQPQPPPPKGIPSTQATATNASAYARYQQMNQRKAAGNPQVDGGGAAELNV
jgi:hypothetical protein